MAQSLCKIYLYVIFHIKTTSPQVSKEHLPRLHAYVGQLVNSTGCNVICIGGTENHVHALLLLSSTVSVAHLLEEMKRNSSRWLKTVSPIYDNFSWQGGYAAFSVSQSVVDKTIEYINNQLEHHKKRTYREEYLEFLELYNIKYNERFVLSD